MIKAVIFDMDGLMIETEHLQSKSFEHVLTNLGIKPEFNQDGVIQIVGVAAKENLKILKEKHGIAQDVESLLKKKQKFYIKLLLQNLKPKKGLFPLLKKLKKKGLKLAIASSSSLEHIKLVLKGLGLSDDFDVIVSGESVPHGKPHPDVFLKAAEKLNVDPGECLVLEDAQSGVEAAFRAKMQVIAVPSKYTKSHDFAKADLIVPSLEKITIDIITT